MHSTALPIVFTEKDFTCNTWAGGWFVVWGTWSNISGNYNRT